MKLYGIWVAQDESDIIEQTIEYIEKMDFFERIFFFDLGSKDNTLEIAQSWPDLIDAKKLDEPYSGAMRVRLIQEQANHYNKGDWVAIIDSDEFYFEDPRIAIQTAEAEEATHIETAQAHFYMTTSELENYDGDDKGLPIFERRLNYLVNWSEVRFYKCLPEKKNAIDLYGKCGSRRVTNRHYPYRTPEQIQTKLDVRLKNRRQGGNPQYQFFSNDWKDYIVDDELPHHFDGTIQFDAPKGINWREYFDYAFPLRKRVMGKGYHHPAYNNIFIAWMSENGYLEKGNIVERMYIAACARLASLRRKICKTPYPWENKNWHTK